MSFTAPKFTGVGRQLQTRVIAGDTLTFTAIKLGDGTMTTEPIAALTDLIHGIIALPVHEVRRNADYAEVTGVFQNAGLSSGFYWREIGIFAADPDYPNDRSHDILYCYQNAAELAEYIPSASSAVIEKIIRVACVVGDAESVTVGLASQAYAKAEDLQALEEQYSKDVERINDALDAIDPTKVTAKAEPADGDGVMIADSADGGKAKRLLWSNVKAALGKLFVPLARKINGKALSADVTLTAADIKMPDSEEDVGAAMAKRAVDGTILFDGIDLNDIDTSGMYRVQKPKNGVYDYGQLLVIHGYGDTIAQVCFDYAANRCAVRCARGLYGASPKWEDWTAIALCAAPEVHDLPLADGWQTYGTSINWYSRDQFGQVTVCFRLKSTSETDCNGVEIAVLPEGFKPQNGVTVPGLITFANYTRMPCHVDINANGVVQLYADGSIPSDQKVIELTCAEFHYPAG